MSTRKKASKAKKTSKAAAPKRSVRGTSMNGQRWETVVTDGYDDLSSTLTDILNKLDVDDQNTRPVQALSNALEALNDELTGNYDKDTVHEILGQISHIETSIYVDGSFQPAQPDANDKDYDTKIAKWFNGIDTITWNIANSMGINGNPVTPGGTANQNVIAYYNDVSACVDKIWDKLDDHLLGK